MELVFIVVFLLFAVVASGTAAKMLPFAIPLPLVQIALGIFIASTTNIGITLNPELFLALFLPPLLFLDGWRIPKDSLFRDGLTIIALAFGLVFLTVLGAGLFIHWIIPAMPMPVAFALAAILSPTDPVAVSAITSRVPIPKRLAHILEGESLLNDASGLVCMRFAVAAALSGTFSFTAAAGTFVWLVVVGVAAGTALTIGIIYTANWMARRFGDETATRILISLIVPFAAYFLAKWLGASDVLAAISAGITMSYAEKFGAVSPITRLRSAAIWDTIQYTANAVMFILLGEQLPRLFEGAAQTVRVTGHINPLWLLGYAFAIALALIAVRFFWVSASLRLTLTRRGQKRFVPSWRLVAATSFAGVRGAVTLAGVLTLPLTLEDGSPFPARDLAIFLAGSVIILSLIAASFALPLLLKGLKLPLETTHLQQEDQARVAAAKAAISAVETLRQQISAKQNHQQDAYAEAGAMIVEFYRKRLDKLNKRDDGSDAAKGLSQAEHLLWQAALRAERDEVNRRVQARELPDETAHKLVREIDIVEARFETAR